MLRMTPARFVMNHAALFPRMLLQSYPTKAALTIMDVAAPMSLFWEKFTPETVKIKKSSPVW
jgi:hypothetical protein